MNKISTYITIALTGEVMNIMIPPNLEFESLNKMISDIVFEKYSIRIENAYTYHKYSGKKYSLHKKVYELIISDGSEMIFM